MRKVHYLWIYIFTVAFKYQAFDKHNQTDNQEYRNLLEQYIQNIEENLQMRMEHIGAPYIEQMLRDDTAFYVDEYSCIEFTNYLATQLLRTKKTRDQIVSASNLKGLPNLKSSWHIISHIFATNFAWSMFKERAKYDLLILHNSTDKNLITGDQPVINIHPSTKNKDSVLEDISMYYPLSPKKAMILSPKNQQRFCSTLEMDEDDVRMCNKQMYDYSHEQIYGKIKTDVIAFG